MAKKLPPFHPGEILLEQVLKPLGLSQYRLASSPRSSSCTGRQADASPVRTNGPSMPSVWMASGGGSS